jgi:hypothetical protein
MKKSKNIIMASCLLALSGNSFQFLAASEDGPRALDGGGEPTGGANYKIA